MVQYNDYPTVIDYGTYFKVPFNIKQIEFGYEAETIDVIIFTREELIKSLIKRKYSLDNEISILNNKNTGEVKYINEYEEYQQYRTTCKTLANTIYDNISA